MPIKSITTDSESGQALDTHLGVDGHTCLITESNFRLIGSFKTATYNNETATLVTPLIDGSIQLTDIIVTSEKKLLGIVTVQFTDGVNTVIIMKAEADSPIQIAHGFQGHWHGWRDAYIQVIVSAAFDVTVALGYVRVPKELTITYNAWNALR
jgi:hypothetical protein